VLVQVIEQRRDADGAANHHQAARCAVHARRAAVAGGEHARAARVGRLKLGQLRHRLLGALVGGGGQRGGERDALAPQARAQAAAGGAEQRQPLARRGAAHARGGKEGGVTVRDYVEEVQPAGAQVRVQAAQRRLPAQPPLGQQRAAAVARGQL